MATLRILRSDRNPLWALLKRLLSSGYLPLSLSGSIFLPLLGLLFLAFFVVRCSPSRQYAPFPLAGLDAFVVNSGGMTPTNRTNRIYIYESTGGFGVKDASTAMDDSQGVALGDLDGDGDLDAFVANTVTNQIYINDGSGNFTATATAPPTMRNSQGVALGDLDGDGHLDAFVVNYGQLNRLYYNTGSSGGVFRGFTNEDIPVSMRNSQGVALGDLDGDGDLDAVVVNNGQFDEIYINDGAKTFTPREVDLTLFTNVNVAGGRGVALGDLDGDGHLDAFVANASPTNHIYTNKGNGSFIPREIPASLPGRDSQGVALGDLDGDGDLDAFVVNTATRNPTRNGEKNRIYTNDGAGGFIASDAPGGMRYSLGVALGDLDGDGDLDALVANDGRNQIYINDGAGGFIVSEAPSSRVTRGVSLGDLHGR